MLLDDGAEAGLGSFDWAVHKRQLGDIVFVNHAQYGSLLDSVDLWVHQLRLVDRGLLVEAVRRDQLRSVVLGQAM